MSAAMVYEFDLILAGLDLERGEDHLRSLDTAVDDITLASHGGVVRAAVERRARNLADAIRSAVADVEAVPGVTVLRVEPDEHVSQVEIASRLGRSRQSVSQLVSGSRGPGGFPPPAIRSGHVMLWRWTDVSEWARGAGIADAEADERRAAVVRAANALLEARRAVAALDEDERASLENLVA